MTIALGVVVAGTIGTLVRVLATNIEAGLMRQIAGTLAVNAVGSLILGLLSASNGNVALITGIGGIGALTTFSTFISQVETLNREKSKETAATYVLVSVILGVTSALVGIAIRR